MLDELEEAVDKAEANAFEAKVTAKRAATRAEVRETVAAISTFSTFSDERMSTLEAGEKEATQT